MRMSAIPWLRYPVGLVVFAIVALATGMMLLNAGPSPFAAIPDRDGGPAAFGLVMGATIIAFGVHFLSGLACDGWRAERPLLDHLWRSAVAAPCALIGLPMVALAESSAAAPWALMLLPVIMIVPAIAATRVPVRRAMPAAS